MNWANIEIQPQLNRRLEDSYYWVIKIVSPEESYLGQEGKILEFPTRQAAVEFGESWLKALKGYNTK